MTLLSHDVHSIDVPEVANFSTKFVYDHFVPDESVNENTRLPDSLSVVPSEKRDATFEDRARTRVPRYVKLMWSVPHLKSSQQVIGAKEMRDFILTNLDNVVTEDSLASSNFVSAVFHDGFLADKVYYNIANMLIEDDVTSSESGKVTVTRKLQRASAIMHDSQEYPEVLHHAVAQSYLDLGVLDDPKQVKPHAPEATSYINVQVNSSLCAKMLRDAASDPFNEYTLRDMSEMISLAEMNQQLVSRVDSISHESFVQPIAVDEAKGASFTLATAQVQLAGYIIDKFLINRDGSAQPLESIVVPAALTSTTIDTQVKYGSYYAYTIRALYVMKLPAINQDTGGISTVTLLVSSRPSTRSYAGCIEQVPPPPPADVSVTWDYTHRKSDGTNGSLLISWSPPTTSQRDVKKYQVFRRASLSEPFELIREYDFDDSQVKYASGEVIDPKLTVKTTSPMKYFYDEEFKRDSVFVYAICAIDAHGLTSNYSMQLEVRFDKTKNRSVTKLVSRSGAPKQYPNTFIARDLFEDTMRVSGNLHNISVVLNPEFYRVVSRGNKKTRVLETQQSGGKYVLQLINTDLQKDQQVTIELNDQMNIIGGTAKSL